jgi:hypothetical protein
MRGASATLGQVGRVGRKAAALDGHLNEARRVLRPPQLVELEDEPPGVRLAGLVLVAGIRRQVGENVQVQRLALPPPGPRGSALWQAPGGGAAAEKSIVCTMPWLLAESRSVLRGLKYSDMLTESQRAFSFSVTPTRSTATVSPRSVEPTSTCTVKSRVLMRDGPLLQPTAPSRSAAASGARRSVRLVTVMEGSP